MVKKEKERKKLKNRICNLATALDVEIIFLCAYLLSNSLPCTDLFANPNAYATLLYIFQIAVCFSFVIHLNLSVANLHVQID